MSSEGSEAAGAAGGGGLDLYPRFYHGTVARVFYGRGCGAIRTQSGREIPFEAPHVRIIGRLPRVEGLREGMEVGFDVSHTSRGLRVTVIRVYD